MRNSLSRINAEEKYAFSREFNGRLSPVTWRYRMSASPWLTPVLLLKMFHAWTVYLLRCLPSMITGCFRRRPAVRGRIRPIALYLPQYHRFPENDAWWGEGFTEWTNVRKARPLFAGHYQPHVPHPDVGYYDLTDVNVMRRQVDMAKEHGIYGFCFYYYHFKNGKRLLERPLDNWLKAKDIDFPFCFAWANENWTRAWDGGDKEVIMPQDYGEENMMAMMRDMIGAFRDPRYIKVGNGRIPILLVYRAEIVPGVQRIVAKWRALARDAGFDDLYLVSMQGFEERNPHEMGFDAATAFATSRACDMPYERPGVPVDDMVPASRRGLVIKRYSAVARQSAKTDSHPGYPRYKMVCPGWDNTPRRGNRGIAVVCSTPKLFASAFAKCCSDTLQTPSLQETGFVFINAWNEWGEGAHLEPDERHGYAYLDAVAKTVAAFGEGRRTVV